jgi:hypothetical protein
MLSSTHSFWELCLTERRRVNPQPYVVVTTIRHWAMLPFASTAQASLQQPSPKTEHRTST